MSVRLADTRMAYLRPIKSEVYQALSSTGKFLIQIVLPDKTPKPVAPKNSPHIKMHVEIESIGIVEVSQTQSN